MRKRIIYIIAILGLALGIAACTTEPQIAENWELNNVSAKDAVENIPCNEINSAQRQITQAVNAIIDFDEPNQETLSTLGLWKEGEFDKLTWEGNPKAPENAPQHAGVQKRLEGRQTECANGTSETTTSAVPTVAATSEDCKEGWPLTYDPNKDLNVMSDGVDNAKEDIEAIKSDPRNLAYRAHNLEFWDNPNNWKPLTTNDGKCISREGEMLFAKVEGGLTAKGVTVDENALAPASYYNTGMNADGPLVNPTPGITGDRSAIVYTLEDGTKVIVLKRCANLALPAPPKHYHKTPIPGSTPPPGKGGPPPVTQPPGKPPVTQPPGTTQPPPPPPPAPKAPQQDPYPRGNAPIGGGPNANPGPGVQQPYMPPPAAPYTPPPPPPPVVVPPAQGGPAPIETPRYTPPPETGAPAPSAPETACIPPPGGSC